jgi:hypothetical protein
MISNINNNPHYQVYNNRGSATNENGAIKAFESAMKLEKNKPTTETSSQKQQRSADTVQFSAKAMSLLQARNIGSQDRETYKNIMMRAESYGGYNDPKAFLGSLSEDELRVVNKIHSGGVRIEPEKLDFEGAFNLLVQPGDESDVDNNGQIQHGLAKVRVFPPTTASAAVKNAFDEASAGFSGVQKSLMSVDFHSFEISANIKYDPGGQVIGVYQLEEDGYIDIYSESGFSYGELARKALANIEKNTSYHTENLYQQKKSFMEDFIKALDRNNVV